MRARVTLVGYRACGKTTLGRALAERLGWRSIDADAELARALGPIPAFFAAQGEAAFREREAQALRALLADAAPGVLSTGGGVVLRADNRAALRADGGLVCYLAADAATLQARLALDAGDRPSLTGASVVDEVPALLARRDPLYREVADAVVDAARPRDEVLAALVGLARSHGLMR